MRLRELRKDKYLDRENLWDLINWLCDWRSLSNLEAEYVYCGEVRFLHTAGNGDMPLNIDGGKVYHL